MAQTWKDILHPGTYRLRNGRVVTYTPADIRNAATVGKRMLAAGLQIGNCWEHDSKFNPVYLSETKPQDWFGDVVDYRIGSSGELEALIEVPDPSDAERLKHVRTVSPRLNFNFVDSKGRKWPGLTVGHVAATLVPVQTNQRPVDLSRSSETVSDQFTHYLSNAERVTMDMAKILAALKALGINLPETTTPENLEHSLAVLAGAGVKATNGTPEPTPDPEPILEDDDDEEDDKNIVNGMPPVMLSMMDRAAKGHQLDLESRIKRLVKTGRVQKATGDQLMGELKAANLSRANLDKDFQLKSCPVLDKIKAFETLPKGRFTHETSTNLSGLEDAELPDQLVGKSEPTAQQIREHILGKK